VNSAGSANLAFAALLGGGGLAAFIGAMRYLKSTADGTVDHQADEIAYLAAEVAKCRAESAQIRTELDVARTKCSTLELKMGMLVGLLQRHGIEVPGELHG
jgi:hypothetical protein